MMAALQRTKSKKNELLKKSRKRNTTLVADVTGLNSRLKQQIQDDFNCNSRYGFESFELDDDSLQLEGGANNILGMVDNIKIDNKENQG